MIKDIELFLPFFREFIIRRLSIHFSKKDEEVDLSGILTIDPGNAIFVNYSLTQKEFVVILLSFIPHLFPNFFDSIIQEFLPQGGEFPEFGGIKSGNHRGMMPTGETAIFLLAGNNLQHRLEVQKIFSEEHFFNKQKILWLEEVREGEPRMSGRLILSEEWIEKWMYGRISKPRFGADFPAKNIETRMNWDDAVLSPQTLRQIEVIATWLQHNEELMKDDNLSRKLKPGYRVLFYGSSGTGKTLTASLLGKQFRKEVYRIDLSQVVSKYIGETEKNLEKVFSKAENKNWILFFDEADALFGKRTSIQNSHDRYANQEISYLLQRIEDFPGLIILASNFKSNIDPAFIRRFHQIIYFPAPDNSERLILWQKAIPSTLTLHPETDLTEIARQYQVTGAAILNVMQFASLQAIKRKDHLIHAKDLVEGIQREFQKEDKSV
ncbi:MAG: ATP-binding protein [Bacteroidetes bacterium]|nr:ATP-binding protein [Bacteroidota bacterium]